VRRPVIGEVRVSGAVRGTGFLAATGSVITADHVLDDVVDPSDVEFVAGGTSYRAVGMTRDTDLDVAVLEVDQGPRVRLGIARATAGARWLARSLVGGPDLSGRVTTARKDHVNDSGAAMQVTQLHVDQHAGGYSGFSGSPVQRARSPRAVVGVLIEQLPHTSLPGAANVLYAVPIDDVVARFKIRNTRWLWRRAVATAITAVTVLAAVVVWVPAMVMDCPPWRLAADPTHPQLLIASKFRAPGREPTGLTFDGSRLWVSDGAYAIFRLGLDGQILGSYEPTNPTPEGITWDGQTFWLFTTNFSTIDHFRIDGAQTKTLGSIDPPSRLTGGDLPHDLAWDGQALWFAEQYTAFRLSTTGKPLGQFTKADNITGIEVNGSDVWLGYDSFPDGTTIELTDRTGRTIRTFSAAVHGLTALAWANSTLWGLGQEEFAGEPYVYRFDVTRSLAQPTALPSPATSAEENPALEKDSSVELPADPPDQAAARC